MRKTVIAVLLISTIVMMNSLVAMAEDGAYIKIGDYNSDVIALHQKLGDLGYYSLRPESPWSSKSSDAVRAVQYVVGLDETGRIESRDAYDAIMSLDENEPVFAIKKINIIDDYLDYIKDQGLTAIISAQDEASNKLAASTNDRLKKLGLSADWNSDMFHKAYIAVIAEDGVVEKVASEPTGEPLRAEGNIGTLSCSVISAGYCSKSQDKNHNKDSRKSFFHFQFSMYFFRSASAFRFNMRTL